jgi:hypothetical protein
MRATLLFVLVSGVLLTCTGPVSAQSCGWDWVNPAPPRHDIYRLKQANSYFVGVGAAGTVIRSLDGEHWEIGDSTVEKDLYGIDWGAGYFVAVGDGVVLRSVNGRDWTVVDSHGGVTFLDVEFSASRFVAVGDGLDGHILTSTMGVEWELVPVPWFARSDSITGFDHGFFAAVGNEIWSSPDGFEWVYEGAVPAQIGFIDDDLGTKKVGIDLFELDRIDLAWSGSHLLWAGGSELWSQQVEREWVLVAYLDGCAIWEDWLGVIAGSGWAMASGIAGCPTPYLDPIVSLAFSTDGGESFHQPWEDEYGGFPAVARYGQQWVALGALGDLLTSANGYQWSCPHGGCTALGCADELVDVVWNGGSLLAVGGVGRCDETLERKAGGTVAKSIVGANWDVDPFDGGRFRSVTWTGLRYVGVGDGWVSRSTDGLTWSTDAFPDGAYLTSVAAGNGLLVAVGLSGALYNSSNGVTWQSPHLNLTEDIHRVVWDGDLFVAVGNNGFLYRSPDGLNWSRGLAATEANLHGAAASGEQRVAVGADGTILGSTDGLVWLPRLSGVTSHLHDVAWGDDRFVAVGWDDQPDGSRSAVVLVSADGDRWTKFDAVGEALHRSVWTESVWVAVGSDRAIITTDCLGTIIEVDNLHLQVPHEGGANLMVGLSDNAPSDIPLSVESSDPDAVSVPETVTVTRGSNQVLVRVTGHAVASNVVLTLSLPPSMGGGVTTSLVSVQPPEWTPRTPGGRRSP